MVIFGVSSKLKVLNHVDGKKDFGGFLSYSFWNIQKCLESGLMDHFSPTKNILRYMKLISQQSLDIFKHWTIDFYQNDIIKSGWFQMEWANHVTS